MSESGKTGIPLSRFTLTALGTVTDLGENFDQEVDFGGGVVEVETGPGTGRDSEAVVEGPSAMVAGADGDALQVEELGDVVRVRLVERKADEASAVIRVGAEDVETVDLTESFVGVAR